MTSNASSNIQWLLNGIPIPGATSPTYVVTQTGRYSVHGAVNGCGALTSTEVYLAILATEPVIGANALTVYPNPATKQITVSLASALTMTPLPTVRLTDTRGLTVRRTTLQRDGKNYTTLLDTADLPDGMYFVVITGEKTLCVLVKRINKQ